LSTSCGAGLGGTRSRGGHNTRSSWSGSHSLAGGEVAGNASLHALAVLFSRSGGAVALITLHGAFSRLVDLGRVGVRGANAGGLAVYITGRTAGNAGLSGCEASADDGRGGGDGGRRGLRSGEGGGEERQEDN